MSKIREIVSYYCAHGCNICITHGLYDEKPSEKELAAIICQKCRKSGFKRQNEPGVDENPDLTQLRREKAMWDDLYEVFHKHTLFGSGFLPVPEITTLPIGGEFAIHIKGDERVRIAVGNDKTKPNHIQNCYAMLIAKLKRTNDDGEADK